MFYNIMLHAHSGLRWLVLIALIIALFQTFSRRGNAGQILETKSALFTLILTHLQLIVGIILYVINPKLTFGANTMIYIIFRFFTMDNFVNMINALLLISLPYSNAKLVELPFNNV